MTSFPQRYWCWFCSLCLLLARLYNRIGQNQVMIQIHKNLCWDVSAYFSCRESYFMGKFCWIYHAFYVKVIHPVMMYSKMANWRSIYLGSPGRWEVTMFSLWSCTFSCCLNQIYHVKGDSWLAFALNPQILSLKPVTIGSPDKQKGPWWFYFFMLGNTNFLITKLERRNTSNNTQVFLQTFRLLRFLSGCLWELFPIRPV